MIIGLSFIEKKCAQYLLSHDDQTNTLYRYKRSHVLIDYSTEENKFNYSFGFKNKYFRKFKQIFSFTLYIFFAILAFLPIFFWKYKDENFNIYKNITGTYSIEVFWISMIFWIFFFSLAAFSCINYSAKIHFAEKIVDKKPDLSLKNLLFKLQHFLNRSNKN